MALGLFWLLFLNWAFSNLISDWAHIYGEKVKYIKISDRAYSLIINKVKKLASDKHSSLFTCSICDQEKSCKTHTVVCTGIIVIGEREN